ncbi:phage tail tape measure protein, partial [Pseudomonas sp. 21TX0197]|nr:phage tail tape measure protein [Pseudomonas sp. 21TX0197]
VRGLTKLSDGAQPVVMGIAGITAGLIALKSAASAVKIGKGLYNITRGRAMERGAGALGDAVAKAPKTGIKTVDKGLGVLGKLMGAEADPAAGISNEPQRVFVVNADAIGRAGSGPGVGPSGGAGRRQRGRRGRRSAIGTISRRRLPARMPSVPTVSAPVASVMPKVGLLSAVPIAAAAEAVPSGSLGMAVKSLRGVTRATKRIPGGSVLDAGVGVLDTALNATTRDEKAEGYGGAAGGLAGALAGGAAGAAIGSVVPIIGSAIGGAIGAALGGLGGESIGGFLGKSWFGSEAKAEETKPPEVAKPAESATPVPPKVEQAFSFAPAVSITVQGDVKDPAQLARELEPHLRQLMEAFSRETLARQSSNQLFDAPHV